MYINTIIQAIGGLSLGRAKATGGSSLGGAMATGGSDF